MLKILFTKIILHLFSGLRKLLLKKLRFREILKEHMKPPEEILEKTNEDVNSKARHKGNDIYIFHLFLPNIPEFFLLSSSFVFRKFLNKW